MKLLILLFISCFNLSVFGATIYITQSGSGTMDGSSWNNAASGDQLQAYINTANLGDEIWVACGTYYPTNGLNRKISL